MIITNLKRKERIDVFDTKYIIQEKIMRIIGRRTRGDIGVYEIVSFTFFQNETCGEVIVCSVTDGYILNIRGKGINLNREQCEKYALEIYISGNLNLVDDDVELDTSTVNVPVYLADIHTSYTEVRYGGPTVRVHNIT
ncbi:hypothetical protein [Natranaerovirga pectinivora]|uniref:hypothetical protein n=1 Tax=Natranaerovirga pectinivora TaxID=682400 RepID=UPI001405339E|nr:hypothetical protein [Natranaerovirga pectinivora]